MHSLSTNNKPASIPIELVNEYELLIAQCHASPQSMIIIHRSFFASFVRDYFFSCPCLSFRLSMSAMPCHALGHSSAKLNRDGDGLTLNHHSSSPSKTYL